MTPRCRRWLEVWVQWGLTLPSKETSTPTLRFTGIPVLQWGLTLPSKETRMSANIYMLGFRNHASMGPHSSEQGNVRSAGINRKLLPAQCFNGASLFRARKRVSARRFLVPDASMGSSEQETIPYLAKGSVAWQCFNGASLFRARKRTRLGGVSAYVPSDISGFNGASLFRARKHARLDW